MHTIGMMIQEVRKSRNLSREGLILLLEKDHRYILTRSRLGRIERDESKKSLDDIYMICKVLEIPFSDVLQCDDIAKSNYPDQM